MSGEDTKRTVGRYCPLLLLLLDPCPPLCSVQRAPPLQSIRPLLIIASSPSKLCAAHCCCWTPATLRVHCTRTKHQTPAHCIILLLKQSPYILQHPLKIVETPAPQPCKDTPHIGAIHPGSCTLEKAQGSPLDPCTIIHYHRW